MAAVSVGKRMDRNQPVMIPNGQVVNRKSLMFEPVARIAKKDPRPSLEARYHDHAGYVAAVKAAADKDVKARVLLAEDADRLVRQAEASNVLK